MDIPPKASLIRSDAAGRIPPRYSYQALRTRQELTIQSHNLSFLTLSLSGKTVQEDILESLRIIDNPISSEKVMIETPNSGTRSCLPMSIAAAVCGFNVRIGNVVVALEAAHIKWHQAGGADIQENGLSLCSLHHKLFDRGAFTVDADWCIVGLRKSLRFRGIH